MIEKEEQKKEIKKYLIISIVFVISLAMIGLSLSYAYFTINFKNPGEEDPITVPNNTAANLNVTSTIDDETTKAINTTNLALIESTEVEKAAEHVRFTITNHGPGEENQTESNIDAKYTISIVEMSLSKNLFSKYFKWKIVIQPEDSSQQKKEFTGTFEDEKCKSDETKENCIAEGTTLSGWEGGLTTPSDEDMVTGMTKQLLTEGQPLKIGKTDTIDFYIWLENDPVKDQLYLTNGAFSGKLSVSAVPDKAN